MTQNKIITKTVSYRGQEIPVEKLKEKSQIKVIVECPHGEREVRWVHRNRPCKKCAAEAGFFNTSRAGRDVSWGDKISKAKKGKSFTEEHKEALLEARRKKLCERQGIERKDFLGFPTRGEQFRLRCFLMSRIRRNIINKTVKEQEDIIERSFGFSTIQLKAHLESKFQPGMTWENYGEWHIDHVIPDSWFNYSSTEDQGFRESWSLDNLQPMWAAENIKKGNRYSGPYRVPHFYMLAGQSGAGKTTLAQMVSDRFNVIHYDQCRSKNLESMIKNEWFLDKPILLDIPLKINTNIKKFRNLGFDITVFFIIEDEETIKSRLSKRGGRIDNVSSRHKRMVSLASRFASFAGTFEEVKNHIDSLVL